MAKHLVSGVLGLLFASGCSAGSTIPAHAFDATVEYNGLVTHGVVAFPERDAEEMHTAADDSCGFLKGNCGSDAPTLATLSGDAPILGASYTTLGSGDGGIYDVAIRQTPEDDAALAKDRGERGFVIPGQDGIACRIYDTAIGKRGRCYGGRSEVFITLTRR